MGSSDDTQDKDDSAAESNGGSSTKTDTDADIHHQDSGPHPLHSSQFSQGEKVLAFHKLRIYPAKVLRNEYRMEEWRYYVHYLGWSKNWDEWVGMDRLLKFTEENVQKQQALNKNQNTDKNIKPGRASHSKYKSSAVVRGKKRKNDSLIKEMVKLVSIPLLPTLKKQLLDDCEYITHLGKLVKLPCTPNIDDILKKYHDYWLKKDGLIADSVGEILEGLRSYFDKALPLMLLYKSERQQYEEAIGDDVSPSTVYGAEHLLRLFVKLPELLFHANIEEETLTELQQKLVDFLKFLQTNQSAFFLSTYHVPEDMETGNKKQDEDE